ncbi:MAG: DUF4129 domain-containing protein, partial [Betaproteobacteria bacterium]|nr:DUF4129 domain-containing protein [Betaproteobacteria bacterium]
APRCIESGLSGAAPGGLPLPMLMRQEFEWLRALRNNWDAVAHKWNVWVLGYNPERQRMLMSWLGAPDADWRKLAMALLSSLATLAALLLAWSLRDATRRDPVQAAWESFCAKLGRRGMRRAPHEGPRDFSARAALDLPSAQDSIERIGALYVALRYGAPDSAHRVAELRRLVNELRLE